MIERYIYAKKVGAGPEHPKKRWGLFSEEITADEAARLYSLDAVHREDWFGVLLLEEGRERPSAYLQVCPRANGVQLHKLNEQGSIEAGYTWRAYYDPSDSRPYDGNEARVFLSTITWYVYPEEERFFMRTASLGHVSMVFGVDGYGKEEQVIKRGFGEPSDVETREFRDVDVSANWFEIPEFGDWAAFFHPGGDRRTEGES